ncbi:hypothetical protein CEXT_294941 [Caerostris extrusa]|uniref:Uncharacterized protein n=1 Tax=Caerostris extrusa TaxID=172846 RepID=A0AAV4RNP9_CAEEX|nr:hypothetical protein CEXT_294941 [Caerostris extrusa]
MGGSARIESLFGRSEALFGTAEPSEKRRPLIRRSSHNPGLSTDLSVRFPPHFERCSLPTLLTFTTFQCSWPLMLSPPFAHPNLECFLVAFS